MKNKHSFYAVRYNEKKTWDLTIFDKSFGASINQNFTTIDAVVAEIKLNLILDNNLVDEYFKK